MSASPTSFRVVAAARFGAMGGYLASVTLAWVAFCGAFAAAIAVASAFTRHAPPGATGGVTAGTVFGVVFVVTLAASTGLVLRSVVRRRVPAVAIAALVLPLTPLHVVALWLVARESHETWGTLVAAFPRGEWALFAPACAAGMLAFIWREMVDNQPVMHTADPYDLARFVEAQAHGYAEALAEIRHGQKRSHWMWYVFPQCQGLGFSPASRRYAITSLREAEAYLRHPVLGPRLVECAQAILGVEGRSALEVFGAPDNVKLRSCATLFGCVSPAGSVFEQILDRYFDGERDEKTLQLMGRTSAITLRQTTSGGQVGVE